MNNEIRYRIILLLCILLFQRRVICQDNFAEMKQQWSSLMELTLPPEVICNYQLEDCGLEENNGNSEEEELHETEQKYDYTYWNNLLVGEEKKKSLDDPNLLLELVSRPENSKFNDYQPIDTVEHESFLEDRTEDYKTDDECLEEQEEHKTLINKSDENSKRKKILKGNRRQIIRLKNCCIKGKRIGNRPNVYGSPNLFRSCRELIKFYFPILSQPCRWVINNCCENKALRKFYIRQKGKE